MMVTAPVVPKAIARVLELLELNSPVVKVKLFRSRVPCVSVVVAVAGTVKALPNVNVRADPLNATEPDNETPFVVIVPVPLKVIKPVADHTVVADKVIPPVIVGVPVLVNVNEEPVVLIEPASNAPVNVMVPDPELASKNVESPAAGTNAPLEPPEVNAQLVVLAVVHEPVPPTQYLPPKVQPVLLLTLLAVGAVNVAPPVALLSWILA
jgi:hypothetical protein